MFKTVLLVTFLVSAAMADLKDYPDREAFLVARDDEITLLEPNKELYQTIVKELAAIRKALPVLAHIHFVPLLAPGKLICNKKISLEELNRSSLGPISVENIGHNESLITFTKPYNPAVLIFEVVRDAGPSNLKGKETETCRPLEVVGARTRISRSDLSLVTGEKGVTYLFEEKSDDCFVKCQKRHDWLVKYLDGKVTLESETNHLDKPTTPHARSTTVKF